jgi:hypothetical protein
MKYFVFQKLPSASADGQEYEMKHFLFLGFSPKSDLG